MTLGEIYAPIQEDLDRVEVFFQSLKQVDSPWLAPVLAHSLSDGGKRLRPALVLLSGKLYDYRLEPLMLLAAAVELLHTATLVHDDAIDNSSMRRGRPTVNNVWGEERAVLLGDYLFARAGELAAETNNLRVVKLFSRTLMTISAGELNQIYYAGKTQQARSQYVERIAGKTASLFTLATKGGGILGRAPVRAVRALGEYSYHLGVAFQIADDILDFIGTEEELGKPVGSDLVQGTLTLPAMLLLEHYPDDNPVPKIFDNVEPEQNVTRAIEMVRNSSIVEECYQIAADYQAQARLSLQSLPEGASRRSLVDLTEYVVRRRR